MLRTIFTAGRPTIFRPPNPNPEGTPSIFRREPSDSPAAFTNWDDAPGNIDDMGGTFDSPETTP